MLTAAVFRLPVRQCMGGNSNNGSMFALSTRRPYAGGQHGFQWHQLNRISCFSRRFSVLFAVLLSGYKTGRVRDRFDIADENAVSFRRN